MKLSRPKWLVDFAEWPAAMEAHVTRAEAAIGSEAQHEWRAAVRLLNAGYQPKAQLNSPHESVVAQPSVVQPQGTPNMNISNWLRGVAGIALADVQSVFTKAKAVVAASPLPANLKTDLTGLLNDANADLTAMESLAGSVVGGALADAVDDATTLLLNSANAIKTSGTSLSALSAAEKAVLAQAWTAAKAQGDTLLAQLQAGLDPTAVKAAPADQPSQVPAPAAA